MSWNHPAASSRALKGDLSEVRGSRARPLTHFFWVRRVRDPTKTDYRKAEIDEVSQSCLPPFFLGSEGSPSKIDYTKRSAPTSSNLSTGGPSSRNECGFRDSGGRLFFFGLVARHRGK